jgi:DNA-binding IclR family transcriptional regulator
MPTESKPTTRRKPVAVLLADKLEAMLRDAENGLNATAIAKQASARDTQVRGLLRELESTGRVRRTGAGRASRWRLITDEERVAQRTAELEAVSTPKP